jgi:hypothetical protein
VRPASRVPFPKRPCTERVDAPPPARRPTEAYPCGTTREGNDAGADAAGLECRDLREWSPGGRCAAVQVYRTASHERSPALRGGAAEGGVPVAQHFKEGTVRWT